MDFWFVLPRLLLGFSKMSIHEIFLVVLMVFILTLIKKKIFLNTLGGSSFFFFPPFGYFVYFVGLGTIFITFVSKKEDKALLVC